jgi:parallel beta-helix repeat protein
MKYKNNRAEFVLVGIMILGALMPVPALGAVQNIGSCPAAITTSGNYQLTAELACTLSITASNVSVKLNGHSITPGSSNVGIDIGSFTGAFRLNHVGIEGPGLINGANVGIYFRFTDFSQVGLVTVKNSSNAGIVCGFSSSLTVGSNVTGRNGLIGIALEACTSSTVSGNDASSNGNTGIGVAGPGNANNTISNNTANGNSVAGISINDGTGTRVFGNVTNANGQVGIVVAPPASGTQVFNNKQSLANVIVDLFDASLTCPTTTLWSDNVFQLANPACLH